MGEVMSGLVGVGGGMVSTWDCSGCLAYLDHVDPFWPHLQMGSELGSVPGSFGWCSVLVQADRLLCYCLAVCASPPHIEGNHLLVWGNHMCNITIHSSSS